MKALAFVRHGTETRFLSALCNNHNYDEIVVLAEDRIVHEVEGLLSNSLRVEIVKTPHMAVRRRAAAYVFSFCDSLVRRANRKRGVNAYSYARKNRRRQASARTGGENTKDHLSLFIINWFILTACIVARHLYRDESLVLYFKKSNSDAVLLFDHLGGTDYVACNAKLAGLKVEYFLNNHKDLSIRPYVPQVANSFYIWFSCQTRTVFNICKSQDKMKPVGLVRLENMLQVKRGVREECPSGPRILHCCSDPKRRPYELISLKRIFDSIKEQGLSVKFKLRLNPMDKSGAVKLLESYPFVEVLDHGWRWDEAKFINIPDKKAEDDYARQLLEADFVSALPSTTLVEGYCYHKKLICLLDEESPDADVELEEEKLCIPDTVRDYNYFYRVRTPSQFLEVVSGADVKE